MNVASLIHLMEPDKWYYPFQLRDITGKDHQTVWRAKKKAEDYELIKRDVLGRIYRYQLTEKGCDYHNIMSGTTNENFINMIKKIEKESKTPIKENKAEEIPKIPSDIEDIIKRLRIKPNAKFVISPEGENYLSKLKNEHDYFSRFLDTFSKRRKRKFNLETDKITVLETIKQKGTMNLIEFIQARKGNKKIYYKYTILPMVKRGYITTLMQ